MRVSGRDVESALPEYGGGVDAVRAEGKALDDLRVIASEMTQTVAVQQVQLSLFTATDQQVRNGATGIVNQKDRTTTANVQVIAFERTLVGGCEPIANRQTGGKLQETVAEIGPAGVGVEGAVAGDEENVGSVRGGAGAGHPNPTSSAIRRVVKGGYLLKRPAACAET